MKGLVHQQVIIVTGAGNEKGIGYATVEAALEHEASVIVMIDQNPNVVQLAKNLNEKFFAEVIGFQVDVSNESELTDVVNFTIEKFGRIDSVVNSAAVNTAGTAEDTTAEAFIKTMLINVYSQAYITKLVVPHMRKQGGGAIVNLSSANAFVSEPGIWAYGTSKGANKTSTQQMALEYGKENIRINCVCPGQVNSGFNEEQYQYLGITQEEADKDIDKLHVTGRPIEPWEVAHPIIFLCSRFATSIIGAALPVDAGMTIK